MKAVVSNIVGRVKSDLPGVHSVGGGVITTSAHANASPERNTTAASTGKKNQGEEALGVEDMRVAVRVGGWGELSQMPTVVDGIMNDWNEGILEGWTQFEDDEECVDEVDEGQRGGKRPAMRPATNGVMTNGFDTHMDNGAVDDEEESWGWAGAGKSDRMQLDKLLDECLAIGQ